MTRIYIYEDGDENEKEEVTAEHAIGVMIKDMATDPIPLLDMLCTQNKISFRSLTIEYKGDYPHEWKIYK